MYDKFIILLKLICSIVIIKSFYDFYQDANLFPLIYLLIVCCYIFVLAACLLNLEVYILISLVFAVIILGLNFLFGYDLNNYIYLATNYYDFFLAFTSIPVLKVSGVDFGSSQPSRSSSATKSESTTYSPYSSFPRKSEEEIAREKFENNLAFQEDQNRRWKE